MSDIVRKYGKVLAGILALYMLFAFAWQGGKQEKEELVQIAETKESEATNTERMLMCKQKGFSISEQESCREAAKSAVTFAAFFEKRAAASEELAVTQQREQIAAQQRLKELNRVAQCYGIFSAVRLLVKDNGWPYANGGLNSERADEIRRSNAASECIWSNEDTDDIRRGMVWSRSGHEYVKDLASVWNTSLDVEDWIVWEDRHRRAKKNFDDCWNFIVEKYGGKVQ